MPIFGDTNNPLTAVQRYKGEKKDAKRSRNTLVNLRYKQKYGKDFVYKNATTAEIKRYREVFKSVETELK